MRCDVIRAGILQDMFVLLVADLLRFVSCVINMTNLLPFVVQLGPIWSPFSMKQMEGMLPEVTRWKNRTLLTVLLRFGTQQSETCLCQCCDKTKITEVTQVTQVTEVTKVTEVTEVTKVTEKQVHRYPGHMCEIYITARNLLFSAVPRCLTWSSQRFVCTLCNIQISALSLVCIRCKKQPKYYSYF